MEREITQDERIIPPSRWRLYGWKLAVIWVVLILASLFWSLGFSRDQMLDAARIQARALCQGPRLPPMERRARRDLRARQ